jgi:hypothetical protein
MYIFLQEENMSVQSEIIEPIIINIKYISMLRIYI